MCKLSLSPLPRARAAAVSEARHVGAHCSSQLVSLPYCVRDDCLRQLTCRTRDQSTPLSVSAARKNQDIGQTVALVPDWERPSAPGTFNWPPPMARGRSTAQHPNLCLTYPNKLRNVTQHKSGLVCPWRQASVSESQRAALAVPLTHHATNLIVPMVLHCAGLCCAGPHCPALHCAVLCSDYVVLLSREHQASSQFQPSKTMPSRPININRRPVGCAPQALGSCIVGSHQASPHHRCIDASNGAGGLNSHAGKPK